MSSVPSRSSIDPHLLKYLSRHPSFQHASSAKEFLQHAFYFNHLPPNTVATNLPRHFLGNGSSKLNTENATSPVKYSPSSTATTMSGGKIDSQSMSTGNGSMKKSTKEAFVFDQWLQPPVGSIIQGPPCSQADSSSSSSSSAASSSRASVAPLKTDTLLSSGKLMSFSFNRFSRFDCERGKARIDRASGSLSLVDLSRVSVKYIVLSFRSIEISFEY